MSFLQSVLCYYVCVRLPVFPERLCWCVCTPILAGAFLRSCRTSILRLMLHVEWLCGSQLRIHFLHPWTEKPWNPATSCLCKLQLSSSLPALQLYWKHTF
ncbi:hypothetical protein AMECASPLE_024324 [Ameca splendens]|uniref:Secreted protein n=1 Tax=Ameca splendens TaxID=208324 RepID=A0ABV0ZD89_9TELE